MADVTITLFLYTTNPSSPVPAWPNATAKNDETCLMTSTA